MSSNPVSPVTPPTIDDYFIPDGFSLDPAIRPGLPFDYRGLVLKRMRALRLSTYRPYIHCTRNISLAPYANAQTQVRMQGGTYLWGYWFNVVPVGIGASVFPFNLYVKVTDSATGSGPFGDWIDDQSLGVFSPTNATGIGYIGYPQFFPEPYLIVDPAMLSVEFSNNGKDGETALVQMQFFACVPCDRPQGAVDLAGCV